jgi:hypothetical protein
VARQSSSRDVLPDLLVVVLSIVGGIVLLVRDFSWARLGAMLVLLVG